MIGKSFLGDVYPNILLGIIRRVNIRARVTKWNNDFVCLFGYKYYFLSSGKNR